MAQWVGTSGQTGIRAGESAERMIQDVMNSSEIADYKFTAGGPEIGVVGMDANRINDVIDAVNEYIKRVRNEQSNTIAITRRFNESVFDENVKAAYDDYAMKFDTCIQNLVSQLGEFNDKLRDVKAMYDEHTKTLTGKITESTSKINTGSEYTQSR